MCKLGRVLDGGLKGVREMLACVRGCSRGWIRESRV